MLTGKRGNTVFGLMLILAAIPFVGLVGPLLETRLLPVIAEIADQVRIDGPVITVETRFNKLRSCPVEYAVIDFKPDASPAEDVFTEGTFNRSNGGETRLVRQFVLPRADLVPGELRRTLYYRCHLFWLLPLQLSPLRVERSGP